jgi:dTDP-4-amino-4,6-dideoxygalactose transaminase
VIPLVDLAAQYKGIRHEILAKIEELLESRSFIQGEYVAEFENRFTKLHGASFGSGCSNGTSAIQLALLALGIGRGDEVITVPNTFIATAEGIMHTGAKPVFVDIDPHTYGIDAKKIEAAITPRTRAILPVHLYGNPSDMEAIMGIARKHRLMVVEDCAQAHLAKFGGRHIGTFGDAATFSFYPGKNLGAYGDAGFVFSSTREHEVLVRKLLDHGRMSKYEHDLVGYNHRMDGIQAAILLVKLKYLQEWTDKRRRNAAMYNEMLGDSGIQLMQATPGSEPVYHLYVVQVSNRTEVIDYLKSKGITSSIHYPVPLHLQPALASLGYQRGAFPVTEAAAERIVSLPMCAELSLDQVEFIARECNKVARR